MNERYKFKQLIHNTLQAAAENVMEIITALYKRHINELDSFALNNRMKLLLHEWL